MLCLLSLLRLMNLWHCSIASIPIQLPRLLIHVSICHLNMLIMLLINLILSFISILSAFLTIYIPLGVFTVVLSFMLTGVIPLLRHLSVSLLWFWKSAIFISNFSHHLRNLTLSCPYSDINLVIYRYSVQFDLHVGCNEEYIGESELEIGDRQACKEHQTWPLPGLRKMLTSSMFNTWQVSQCWSVMQHHFGQLHYGVFGRCYWPFTILVVGVIPLVLCHVWLNWHEGRCSIAIDTCHWCNCHILVLNFVNDVIVTYVPSASHMGWGPTQNIRIKIKTLSQGLFHMPPWL